MDSKLLLHFSTTRNMSSVSCSDKIILHAPSMLQRDCILVSLLFGMASFGLNLLLGKN